MTEQPALSVSQAKLWKRLLFLWKVQCIPGVQAFPHVDRSKPTDLV